MHERPGPHSSLHGNPANPLPHPVSHRLRSVKIEQGKLNDQANTLTDLAKVSPSSPRDCGHLREVRVRSVVLGGAAPTPKAFAHSEWVCLAVMEGKRHLVVRVASAPRAVPAWLASPAHSGTVPQQGSRSGGDAPLAAVTVAVVSPVCDWVRSSGQSPSPPQPDGRGDSSGLNRVPTPLPPRPCPLVPAVLEPGAVSAQNLPQVYGYHLSTPSGCQGTLGSGSVLLATPHGGPVSGHHPPAACGLSLSSVLTQSVMYDLVSELHAQHEELEARLATLESRLDALGASLQALPGLIAQAIRPPPPPLPPRPSPGLPDQAARSSPCRWPPVATSDCG
ncbi:hypothetical protein P7K49_033616 [Saguinus oedipus]|uniref:Uncharacterized protein n=1 Tax=Saguinus oedipus TaxID=9490 RepID=A0ABQ9TSF6_SAGOE|nr:hypothetical protein P7K49_033616 [Saguinus oedipus]